MSDRPDFTLLGDVDITAQTLSALKVNITAQTLAKLAVDITTQTLAALKVNITAQDLAKLAVDITTQTLGSLIIKIGAAQTVSIDTFRDWQAAQGNTKSFSGSVSGTGGLVCTYPVPNGKKFSVTEWSFSNQYTDGGIGYPKLFRLVINSVDKLALWAPALGPPTVCLLSSPLLATAGQVISVFCGVGGETNVTGNFLGIEEAA